MDRRKHGRYDLRSPVCFVWKDTTNILRRGKGLLSNISGGGMFVSTNDPPPKGARTHLTVSLRSVSADFGLILRGMGLVVRVEYTQEAEGPLGFATAIKTFSLHNDNRKPRDHKTAQRGPKQYPTVTMKLREL
jgi:hypothetical protein